MASGCKWPCSLSSVTAASWESADQCDNDQKDESYTELTEYGHFPQTSEELEMQLSRKMRAHFKCSDTANTASVFIDTPFHKSTLVYKHHLLKHTVRAVQEPF